MNYLHENLKNILFPQICWICDEWNSGEILCQCCLSEILQQSLTESENPLEIVGEVDLYSWLPSTSLSKTLIYMLKYKGWHKILDKVFDHIEFNLAEVDFWIPVPLHSIRKRERGFNQSALIAEKCAIKWGGVVLEKFLTRKRNNQTQTQFGREQRMLNSKNLFYARSGGLKGRNIVLVDDVFTTGATIEACVEILKRENPASIRVFTLLRAMEAKASEDFNLDRKMYLRNNYLAPLESEVGFAGLFR